MNGYLVMTVILMLHGLAMVQAGAVRGLGMLELATWMVLIAFYFVALPAAYLFTFPLGMGMIGLWWGVVAGALAEISLYIVILTFYCNWEKLAISISQELKLNRSTSYSPNVSMNRSLSGYEGSKQQQWGGIREPLIALHGFDDGQHGKQRDPKVENSAPNDDFEKIRTGIN